MAHRIERPEPPIPSLWIDDLAVIEAAKDNGLMRSDWNPQGVIVQVEAAVDRLLSRTDKTWPEVQLTEALMDVSRADIPEIVIYYDHKPG